MNFLDMESFLLSGEDSSFDRERHIRYFSKHLRNLPSFYDKLDTNRLTLVHFAVHALDMLNVWDDDSLLQRLQLKKQSIINWIYNLQIKNDRYGGFLGGTFLGGTFDADNNDKEHNEYRIGHIAMTYTALSTLYVLGDNLDRVDKIGIISSLKSLQREEDGSFQCVVIGSEHDARFLYCACAISYILNDWSGIDISKACEYIRLCKSYDGSIGLIPGQEGHGGSTFVSIASLVLMKQYTTVIDPDWKQDLIKWCVHRQVGGMQGRPNKVEDTCYSFWIGGTLRLLDYADQLLDHDKLFNFVLSCQYMKAIGGFCKTADAYPDMLHSFYSMSYISFSAAEQKKALQQNYDEQKSKGTQSNEQHEPFLSQINCTLGFCQKRAETLCAKNGLGKLEFP